MQQSQAFVLARRRMSGFLMDLRKPRADHALRLPCTQQVAASLPYTTVHSPTCVPLKIHSRDTDSIKGWRWRTKAPPLVSFIRNPSTFRDVFECIKWEAAPKCVVGGAGGGGRRPWLAGRPVGPRPPPYTYHLSPRSSSLHTQHLCLCLSLLTARVTVNRPHHHVSN